MKIIGIRLNGYILDYNHITYKLKELKIEIQEIHNNNTEEIIDTEEADNNNFCVVNELDY